MPEVRFRTLVGDLPLCGHCFKEMHPKETLFRVGCFKARALYEYNERIRSLLYQFKGCGDIELRDVFLANQAPFLKLLYEGYVLVPAPSFTKNDEERGFNHVIEMFRVLELPYLLAIRKKDDVKQADGNYESRQQIGIHLSFVDGVDVRGKKILFVDDLVTTGATAKACCQMLLDHGAKKVRILAMGHTMERPPKEGTGAPAASS
jgi:predicted amidophosphoribosyltransferase